MLVARDAVYVAISGPELPPKCLRGKERALAVACAPLGGVSRSLGGTTRPSDRATIAIMPFRAPRARGKWRDYDQRFWWRPGTTLPRRGPDLGAAGE